MNFKSKSPILSHENLISIAWNLLAVVSLTLVLLAVHGYIFGESDQIEVLPYALKLNQPALYPSDFYVQYITREVPNERWLFVRLLSPFGDHMDWGAFVGFLICTFSLLLGCFKIARRYIQSDGWAWATVAGHFVLLYTNNLGGNELYYPMFVSSLLAKSLAIWAVYFWLEDKLLPATLLLIPSALVHPVAGTQVFLLMGGSILLAKFLHRTSRSWREILLAAAAFLSTAGVWVLFLKLNFDKGEMDSTFFMEIMRFRVPHHYFPSEFSLKNYLLLSGLGLLGGIYFYRKDFRLFLWIALTVTGCAVYFAGVEVLGISGLLVSQWFKSTIWLKFIGCVALIALLLRFVPQGIQDAGEKTIKTSLPISGLIAILLMMHPVWKFKSRPYQFPFANFETAEQEIAIKAREQTPVNAVFIVPFQNTSFKYFSRRSSFIEYKTMVHRKDALPVWYSRVGQVYGLSFEDQDKGTDKVEKANRIFYSQNEEQLRELSKQGVTHILTNKSHNLNFPSVAENEEFRIYEIEPPNNKGKKKK